MVSKSFLVPPQKHHETQIGHGVQHLVPDVLQSRVLDIQKGSDVRMTAQMTDFIIHNQSLLKGQSFELKSLSKHQVGAYLDENVLFILFFIFVFIFVLIFTPSLLKSMVVVD